MDGDACCYPCEKLVIAKCQAGLSDDDVIYNLNIHRTTWNKWRSGKSQPPRSACLYLHTMTGWFPWPGWERMFINRREQKLYIDEIKMGLSLTDLLAYWWQVQELKVYREEYARQRQQKNELDKVFKLERVK